MAEIREVKIVWGIPYVALIDDDVSGVLGAGRAGDVLGLVHGVGQAHAQRLRRQQHQQPRRPRHDAEDQVRQGLHELHLKIT